MTRTLHSRTSANRKPQALRKGSPENINTGSKLQRRVAELQAMDLRHIPTGEFADLDGDNGPIEQAIRVLESLQTEVDVHRHAASDSAAQNPDDTSSARDWNSDAPLLSFTDEQQLFRALNLLRFRACRLRSRLSPSAPSKKAMDQIDRMLAIVERIRSQLVNSNLRLVSSIARKFSSQHSDLDDFSSDGCMILLGAIDRFDYSRGFRFSTYATHSIQRHFYRSWKVRQRRREHFPNAGAEVLCEVADQVVDEPFCDDPQAVVNDLLANAEAVLDDREHQILISRFGLKTSSSQARTLREIAADLGISKERVRQLQLKALEKLRELLPPELGVLRS
jgi:RNA polymerase primary sigma factor